MDVASLLKPPEPASTRSRLSFRSFLKSVGLHGTEESQSLALDWALVHGNAGSGLGSVEAVRLSGPCGHGGALFRSFKNAFALATWLTVLRESPGPPACQLSRAFLCEPDRLHLLTERVTPPLTCTLGGRWRGPNGPNIHTALSRGGGGGSTGELPISGADETQPGYPLCSYPTRARFTAPTTVLTVTPKITDYRSP